MRQALRTRSKVFPDQCRLTDAYSLFVALLLATRIPFIGKLLNPLKQFVLVDFSASDVNKGLTPLVIPSNVTHQIVIGYVLVEGAVINVDSQCL